MGKILSDLDPEERARAVARAMQLRRQRLASHAASSDLRRRVPQANARSADALPKPAPDRHAPPHESITQPDPTPQPDPTAQIEPIDQSKPAPWCKPAPQSKPSSRFESTTHRIDDFNGQPSVELKLLSEKALEKTSHPPVEKSHRCEPEEGLIKDDIRRVRTARSRQPLVCPTNGDRSSDAFDSVQSADTPSESKDGSSTDQRIGTARDVSGSTGEQFTCYQTTQNSTSIDGNNITPPRHFNSYAQREHVQPDRRTEISENSQDTSATAENGAIQNAASSVIFLLAAWSEAMRDGWGAATALAQIGSMIPGLSWVFRKLRSLLVLFLTAYALSWCFQDAYCNFASTTTVGYVPIKLILPGCSAASATRKPASRFPKFDLPHDDLEGWVARVPNSFDFLRESLEDLKVKIGQVTSFELETTGNSDPDWNKDYKTAIEWAVKMENRFVQRTGLLWTTVNHYIRGFSAGLERAGPLWKFWIFGEASRQSSAKRQAAQLQSIIADARTHTEEFLKDLPLHRSEGAWAELFTKWPAKLSETVKQIQQGYAASLRTDLSLHLDLKALKDSVDIWESSSQYITELLDHRAKNLDRDAKWLASKSTIIEEDISALKSRQGGMSDDAWEVQVEEILTRCITIAIEWRKKLKRHYVNTKEGNQY